MSAVATFKPAAEPTQGGVTHAQAMEAFERFFVHSEAVPTIADRMNIPYKVACDVLDGKYWPGARRLWMDRVLP